MIASVSTNAPSSGGQTTLNVLILGASGLLGQTLVRILSRSSDRIIGVARDTKKLGARFPRLAPYLVQGGDLSLFTQLEYLLDTTRPDVVINCVAARRAGWSDLGQMISLFGLLPRRLQHLGRQRGLRVIHFSSDGVFSGERGRYRETDVPDADDIYGSVKILGEIDGPNTVTIRTSLLGPDPVGRGGLLEWFLAQEGSCRGFSKAVFSGLPTLELAHVVRDVILPDTELKGIFHIASRPISKLSLLQQIAQQYEKRIDIVDDPSQVIDRSLDSTAFHSATGYVVPDWPRLIQMMYEDHQQIDRLKHV